MLKLLFSLGGFLVGLLLSFIAPEELKPGKKYFILIKRILFVMLFFTINLFLYQANQYFYLIPFTILALVLFVIELKNSSWHWEGLNYLIFIVPYFLNTDSTFRLVLPSLLFLYGLPAGTLFRIKRKKL
ncbi:hypothetical protein GOV03_01875 [Candidatus Woesearchaeota archaeon]|nr:hypothetical protein [Candidatus Woesearchaeota archaeon]